MDERIRVTWDDLNIGRCLPWNIYSESGKLLLGAGKMISSNSVLENLCQYRMYRDKQSSDYDQEKSSQRSFNPFILMEDFVSRFNSTCKDIYSRNNAARDKLGRLVKDIIDMCNAEPDASIASIHLPNTYSYCFYHSIQCAIICALMGKHEGLKASELQVLCAAALMSNVSMLKLQNKLFIQGGKATDEEQKQIKSHPELSVQQLKLIGFDNTTLLEIILNHHERLDGSGYPNGITGEKIGTGARILAIADRYGAMVTMRKGRKPMPIKDSLKQFLTGVGKEYDNRLSLLLIKELTIFPPGSCVKLSNGETAIVIRRGKKNPMQPVVKSIENGDGQSYSNPLLRDCSIHEYEISGVICYDRNWRINPSRLWGLV